VRPWNSTLKEGVLKSLVALTAALLRDAANQYSLDPTRDIETVTRRHRLEGEPFLTITLDAFRVAFEAALEAGTWDNILIPGFRKDGHLPAFMRGFVSLVFQRNGRVRPVVDPNVIRCIRQVSGACAKMHVPCKPEYVQRAQRDFIAVDELAISRATADLKAVFADLFDPVMRDVISDIDSFSVLVKHGNGKSQDKIPPNTRWNFARWDKRCESLFPSRLYAHVNDRHEAVAPVEYVAAEMVPARVSFVPKTAKGPRTIAVEPSWRMFIQQGLLRSLVLSIEKRGLPPRFTDSEYNRTLARKGSLDGSLATIDLSSASDSVSSAIVADLTGGRPIFKDAIFACRSSQAELPGGTTRTLNKFASMGSAVCFPIESMVFTAIAVLALAPRLANGAVSLPIDRKVVGQVAVFGDDIIVPTDRYSCVVSALNQFGFKVNMKKSFYKGRFRESCGGDFYAGHSVSFAKVRHPLKYDTTTAIETTSTVSLRNQLAAFGLWPKTVKAMDRLFMDGLRLFPYGTERSPGLVRVCSPEGAHVPPTVGRFNTDLFRVEQKIFYERSTFKRDVLDDWSGLHKSLALAERQDLPSVHPVSYEVAGRAVRVRLNARWLPIP
jgi:hypothetical protein